MDTITGDGVSKAARKAFEAGEGVLRLAPNWVPRSFLQPGKRLKLRPNDYYALGTHRGGIDERWFASTTHAANEGAPGRRRAQLRRPRRRAGSRCATPSPRSGADIIGAGDLEQVQALAGLQQVLRQHGADPAPHAPERRAGRAGRPRGQAGGLLFPAAAQRDRQQLPVHVLRPRAGHDRRRRPPLPRALERGRQRHPRSLQGLPADSPAPAGWSARASCTPPARW